MGIGAVAERPALSLHALRFYERACLLIGPVQRAAGGQRRYSATDVDRLLISAKLRESGMPISSGSPSLCGVVRATLERDRLRQGRTS